MINWTANQTHPEGCSSSVPLISKLVPRQWNHVVRHIKVPNTTVQCHPSEVRLGLGRTQKVSMDGNKSRIQTKPHVGRRADGSGKALGPHGVPFQTSGAIGTWPSAGVAGAGSGYRQETWLVTNRSLSLCVPRRVQSSEAIRAGLVWSPRLNKLVG